MGLLSQAYRAVCKSVFAVGPLKAPKPLTEGGSSQRCLWLHAASAGELESLWTVALELARKGNALVITVFSSSAYARLERLVTELGPSAVRAWGYSPREGSWKKALKDYKPEAFVTVKYEAWPELWVSLSEERVPLVIVAARARSSLAWAKKACRALGSPLPELTLLCSEKADEMALRELFAHAKLAVTGDPRWDRVFVRSKTGHERASELVQILASLPRPWGVLGSAWQEDLLIWKEALKEVKGTLWVFPHKIEAPELRPIREALLQSGFDVQLTSQNPKTKSSGRVAVLVDEMGFLSELYSAAEWAYVGGGFGDGVHSTIEPAIQALPIACGPKNAQKFSEIRSLAEAGELCVVNTGDELIAWVREVQSGVFEKRRETWRQSLNQRLGATERVVASIQAARLSLSAGSISVGDRN